MKRSNAIPSWSSFWSGYSKTQIGDTFLFFQIFHRSCLLASDTISQKFKAFSRTLAIVSVFSQQDVLWTSQFSKTITIPCWARDQSSFQKLLLSHAQQGTSQFSKIITIPCWVWDQSVFKNYYYPMLSEGPVSFQKLLLSHAERGTSQFSRTITIPWDSSVFRNYPMLSEGLASFQKLSHAEQVCTININSAM